MIPTTPTWGRVVITRLILHNTQLVYKVDASSVNSKKGKGSPYSITERRFPELITVLGSQPAGDVSHKPGVRVTAGLAESNLSARPAVTLAILKRAATIFAAW